MQWDDRECRKAPPKPPPGGRGIALKPQGCLRGTDTLRFQSCQDNGVGWMTCLEGSAQDFEMLHTPFAGPGTPKDSPWHPWWGPDPRCLEGPKSSYRRHWTRVSGRQDGRLTDGRQYARTGVCFLPPGWLATAWPPYRSGRARAPDAGSLPLTRVHALGSFPNAV